MMRVMVYYRGHDPALDDEIEMLAGKGSTGSGYAFDSDTRDLEFEFRDAKKAKAFVKKLKDEYGRQVQAEVVR